MIELEQYFNEEYWGDFSLLFSAPIESEGYEFLRQQLDDEELAKVVWATIGVTSVEWIYREVPALDNIKPIDCLCNEALIKRLKVCLLRMP